MKILRYATALLPLMSLPLAADVDTVREALQERMPDVQIESINPAPIEGLYELQAEGQLAYVSADGAYLFAGEILHLETGENLTEARRGELAVAALSELAEDEVITFAPEGEVKHDLYVFTDHTCPFCQRLHEQIGELNEAGVSVHYLLYPRAGLDSKVHQEMTAMWCGDDRNRLLDEAKSGQVPDPVPIDSCDTPIAKHVELAKASGLRGTPLSISGEGVRISGFRPAEVIISMLEGETPAAPQ